MQWHRKAIQKRKKNKTTADTEKLDNKATATESKRSLRIRI